MSKVQPGENYWADVVKMASIVQPAADYWTVDRENLRTRLCDFAERKKQRAKWRNSFKNREIFWMNNKAIIEFGFRWIWRMLQISEGVIHLGRHPLWITPSLICRILHILLSLIQQLLIIDHFQVTSVLRPVLAQNPSCKKRFLFAWKWTRFDTRTRFVTDLFWHKLVLRQTCFGTR